MSKLDTQSLAHCIRFLAADAVEAAKSGHPGMPMGCAEMAAVLFTEILNIDPAHPEWPDRDRFILSAGHGSMLLYALAYLLGYPEMTLEQLKNFRQWGSLTAGHPELHRSVGIETTTGPLGQGFANAVGMAIAERNLAATFTDTVVDHYTYVLAGDGCLMEGISYEAAALAGHLKLNKLIVLWDDNSISIDGSTNLATSEDQLKRFAAAGWRTKAVDGHDPIALKSALKWAKRSPDKPTLLACKTIIGRGAPKKQGTASTHGSPLGADELAATRAALGWPHPAFHVPDELLTAWRTAGKRGGKAYKAWTKRFAALPDAQQTEFLRRQEGSLPAAGLEALHAILWKFQTDQPKIATRQASQQVIEAIVPAIPELLGGSADLSGSNLTKASTAKALSALNPGGNYIHYGVREHAMAAIMNGLAVHGGLIPFGGTFLVFADYLKPSLRLSALMHQRVIYVLTHDSIGVGEDGPTHQPIEHLVMLRSIPNVLVFRPADAIETAECWMLALAQADAPSVLALTRQALPCLRENSAPIANQSAYGGYLLRNHAAPRLTLLATGSEVSAAVSAHELLLAQGIGSTVVSMPSRELFLRQSADYQAALIPDDRPTLVVEAASSYGWGDIVRGRMATVSMTGFGASAPGDVLFEKFGFSPQAITVAARALL
ncbi:MAG: transketolase [Holosporales bacterium]|jgi:transketolase